MQRKAFKPTAVSLKTQLEGLGCQVRMPRLCFASRMGGNLEGQRIQNPQECRQVRLGFLSRRCVFAPLLTGPLLALKTFPIYTRLFHTIPQVASLHWSTTYRCGGRAHIYIHIYTYTYMPANFLYACMHIPTYTFTYVAI